MNNRLIVPYLMGQRRDGLCRVREIDSHAWEVLVLPELYETAIGDANEKIRRMGKIYSLLCKAVEKLASGGFVPMSIAGDCVSSLGMLGGLQKAGKQPDRILWLDAHGDFHTWETTQTKYVGGMPLAMLVGRSDRRRNSRDATASLLAEIGVRPYPEKQVILSDARDLDPGEGEALERSEIVRCEIADIFRYLEPDENFYLHWDTDVTDAEAAMPALKYHVKGGPTVSELRALFRSLRKRKLVAVSVSAWHEEKDLDNKTAHACLQLLNELM